jgi:hypothetical protein
LILSIASWLLSDIAPPPWLLVVPQSRSVSDAA